MSRLACGIRIMYDGLAMPQNDQNSAISEKQPKDLRYRRQFFPEADSLVFNTGEKGFVPVPIILRKLLKHLTPPELRVLIYLHLRASRHSICYPTFDEIVHELGLTGKKNLLPHLRSLEDKKFIATHSSGGKTFFLIHDPRVAVRHLMAEGALGEQELFEINELYTDLNQVKIETQSPEPTSPDT
jgi:hypothetical protein